MYRTWAFWQRAPYIGAISAAAFLVFVVIYFSYFYAPASCFDGKHNGSERGVDCGGSCTRVCAIDVIEPKVLWSEAFKVTDGVYNAVAYIENRNAGVGTSELRYTFSLFDRSGGLITTRSGTTSLPPDSVYPVFEGRIAAGTSVPARTSIEIEPVGNWQKTAAGREQFVVQNRELVRADSAPRLNTTIFNSSLEDARDVEIVATIFNAAGHALTASRSIVPLFEGRATKQVVFTWPEPIATTVRSCEVPTDVILAIDLSGSMNDDGANPPQPLTAVLNAASSFVSRLGSRDQVGVVTFATNASIASGLSSSRSAISAAVRRLTIAPQEETGSTNIGDAIAAATNEFLSPRHSQDARKVLVLLTDGQANAPGEDAEIYAVRKAAEAKSVGVDIFTIGLGLGVNRSFLGSVASNGGGREQYAANSSSLDRIYGLISTALCEEGAAVIDVIPKVSDSVPTE